jgi:hypothetical protein
MDQLHAFCAKRKWGEANQDARVSDILRDLKRHKKAELAQVACELRGKPAHPFRKEAAQAAAAPPPPPPLLLLRGPGVILQQRGLRGKDTPSELVMDPAFRLKYNWYFDVRTTLAAVGYGDIAPKSFIEVGYTCVIFVLGGLLYSLIISSLQEIVAQSDLASIVYQRKNDEITAYVALRNIPALLRSQIKEYTLKLWVQQKAVANETILSFVSTSLRDKLLLEMFDDSCMKKAPG